MSNGLIWVSQSQVGRAHKYKACKSTSSAQACKGITSTGGTKKALVHCTSTSKKEHSAEYLDGMRDMVGGEEEGDNKTPPQHNTS